MNDKSLEVGVIGGKEKPKIEIVEYSQNWPDNYEEHKNEIQKYLGEVALAIEHIGSTSVPNLSAKPIIDILLIVKDSSNEDKYLKKMEAAEYQLRVREPDFHEHRMFRTKEKDVHIHIFSEGSPEIDRYLLFRNRLRNNEVERIMYEQLKINLAKSNWSDMNEYADAKTKFIEQIIELAKKEEGSA